MEQLHTTLALCRQRVGRDGQFVLLEKVLGAKWGDDTPIPLMMLLDLEAGPYWRGLINALWALRAVPDGQKRERDRLARIFACDCAERTLPHFEARYPNDLRPRRCIQVARQFVNGEVTRDELVAAALAAAAALAVAANAAYAAPSDASYAASDAANAACAAANVNASDAAVNASDAAANAAAAGEREWQAERLRQYLRGEA